MAQDDPELVQRWQRSDSAAFEDLVRRWEGPVGQFLGRLVGEKELAQDLSQEVFLCADRARFGYSERTYSIRSCICSSPSLSAALPWSPSFNSSSSVT